MGLLLDLLESTKNFFSSILSDAVRCVVIAGATLKCLYPKLFHETCLAHSLHNCGVNIKSRFKDVDQLIGISKSATVENKNR